MLFRFDPPRDKARKKALYAERALRDLRGWAEANAVSAGAGHSSV